jgi:hypothetical protein
MRESLLRLLAILLIAALSLGAPLPAQADCAECQDCTTEAPARNDVPCPEKGLACQIASSCASQVQKLPAQIAIQPIDDASAAAFDRVPTIATKSAFITPETAPPRL